MYSHPSRFFPLSFISPYPGLFSDFSASPSLDYFQLSAAVLARFPQFFFMYFRFPLIADLLSSIPCPLLQSGTFFHSFIFRTFPYNSRIFPSSPISSLHPSFLHASLPRAALSFSPLQPPFLPHFCLVSAPASPRYRRQDSRGSELHSSSLALTSDWQLITQLLYSHLSNFRNSNVYFLMYSCSDLISHKLMPRVGFSAGGNRWANLVFVPPPLP